MKTMGKKDRFSTFSRWFRVRDGLYYHRNHTWVKIEDGFVKIGVNDFAQKIIGTIKEVRVPPIGHKIEQGKKGFEIDCEFTSIGIPAPIDGYIFERNEWVIKEPSLINRDPYGEGWIMVVSPVNLESNIKSLYSVELASLWIEECVETLKNRTCEFMQDGGELEIGDVLLKKPGDFYVILKDFFSCEGK